MDVDKDFECVGIYWRLLRSRDNKYKFYFENGEVPDRTQTAFNGAQWLNGRVLDSRPRGRAFEPHRRHCVVVLEQDTFILA